ncbi:hypothetical protein MTO96_049793 [Rhipicephalus appendiculatus]
MEVCHGFCHSAIQVNFNEAVLLTSHSNSAFHHQLPSSTTASVCSDLNSAFVAHQALRAIRRDDTFPWAIGNGTWPQRHMDNPFVFIAQMIATLLLIGAGNGHGEIRSRLMDDTYAAHLLPVRHFNEAVLLTSHSNSAFHHQLPSSTTASVCSDLNSAFVAHQALRAIRRDDTFPWAIGNGTWPQRHMDNPFVFIAQMIATLLLIAAGNGHGEIRSRLMDDTYAAYLLPVRHFNEAVLLTSHSNSAFHHQLPSSTTANVCSDLNSAFVAHQALRAIRRDDTSPWAIGNGTWPQRHMDNPFVFIAQMIATLLLIAAGNGHGEIRSRLMDDTYAAHLLPVRHFNEAVLLTSHSNSAFHNQLPSSTTASVCSDLNSAFVAHQALRAIRRDDTFPWAIGNGTWPQRHMDNPFVFIAQMIATLLLIAAGNGHGEIRSRLMDDTYAAHLLPVRHFNEAVLLTAHSNSAFHHQLPSSTTASVCSDLNSAFVAHQALRAIRRDDTFPWAMGNGTWPQRHMDNSFVFIAQMIATLLLIGAGNGHGEIRSRLMDDTYAAHLLPVRHFNEAVLLTSHSNSAFHHQLPSSTTASVCSNLNSAFVAHQALRAIRRDDTFPWAIGNGTWPQRHMDNPFVFIAQMIATLLLIAAGNGHGEIRSRLMDDTFPRSAQLSAIAKQRWSISGDYALRRAHGKADLGCMAVPVFVVRPCPAADAGGPIPWITGFGRIDEDLQE